jgi:hypothetical protein
MIWNIVDGRERPYRWKAIKAIVEPTWHDNKVADRIRQTEPTRIQNTTRAMAYRLPMPCNGRHRSTMA